ncbi:MAG: 1-deoxy-D-xylulose-5-phosphate synthase [Firmicutes bacterium]|nr:1-deoxy-D-xylulose-5-phosphate synthase [Bacillota bacterium]
MNKNEDLTKQIKLMSVAEMNDLASEIKKDMIDTVSRTGGHLASSLGTVELTISLYHVFDSPKDKIVWDVGHQCYASKMLTGRWNRMETLRQYGGLSGFPKRHESAHDASDPGHSGTAISIAYGYAKARDLSGGDYSCVAVIGDGSLTSGVALEALDAAGESGTPLIVILNDNRMSISRSIGGFSRHLQKLRTSNIYKNFKTNLKKMNSPKGVHRLSAIRDSLKYKLMPRSVFDELGFKYYGPVDGHDIESLTNTLRFVKSLDQPVLLHVITQKGNGFAPAMEDPTKFHGVGKYDPVSGATIHSDEKTWSETFGEIITELASKDDRICAVTAAMGESTGLSEFSKKFPDRYFDVGIAEQHAAAFAEGLALNGRKPVVAIYSTFLQRAYDQMLTEICLQDLPVIFAVDRAGVTGPDGETHQGIYDIAYLYSMPGMTIMNPRDRKTMENMFRLALELGTPVAIRYPKNCPGTFDAEPWTGYPQVIKSGDDVLIISDANMLSECLKCAGEMETRVVEGWKPQTYAVCDIGILKPLNMEFIDKCLEKYKYIVTVEDGTVYGGFGSRIAARAAETGRCKVLNIGWPDSFIEHGKISELRAVYGMDSRGIAEKIMNFIGGRS